MACGWTMAAEMQAVFTKDSQIVCNSDTFDTDPEKSYPSDKSSYLQGDGLALL